MKQYLLDTSICVFLFRNKFGIKECLEKIGKSQCYISEITIEKIGKSQCYISEITIAELTYGAYKSNRVNENLHLIDRFVSEVQVVPFVEAIDFYAQEKIVFVL